MTTGPAEAAAPWLNVGQFTVEPQISERRKSNERAPAAVPRSRRSAYVVAVLALVASVAAVASLLTQAIPVRRSPTAADAMIEQRNLNDLLSATRIELEADIALMNLRCAEGLPGSEHLNVSALTHTLIAWAEKVKAETERHLYRVKDPRYADHYKHSDSYFRAEMLLQVLQEDCKAHYNLIRATDPDFRNSKDLFIHGIVGDDNGGTCTSMPVLYAAVGRRLGYPLKLVLTKQHMFCRWESADGKERFNIEGTNGFASFPDEHYMTWPAPWSDVEIKGGYYLKSMTPAQELATFLATRGHCLEDRSAGRIRRSASSASGVPATSGGSGAVLRHAVPEDLGRA